MKNTEAVLGNVKRYVKEVRLQYLADGKLDVHELEELFHALLANQGFLALAIRDVYEAVSRIERVVRSMGGRGPVGR